MPASSRVGGAEQEPPPPPPRWPRVVLVGDSLTQNAFSPAGCWASLLADKLRSRADVVARGFSGYNTRWLLPVIRECLAPPPDGILQECVAAVVFMGANDAAQDAQDAQGAQNVPLEEYKSNLGEMIAYLGDAGRILHDSIVLVTPPPWEKAAWFATAEAKGVPTCERCPERYAAACREVGAACAVTVVDLYAAIAAVDDYGTCLSDGLHLSAKGSGILYELLVPHIEAALDAANVPEELYPNWKDFCQRTDKAKKYMA